MPYPAAPKPTAGANGPDIKEPAAAVPAFIPAFFNNFCLRASAALVCENFSAAFAPPPSTADSATRYPKGFCATNLSSVSLGILEAATPVPAPPIAFRILLFF